MESEREKDRKMKGKRRSGRRREESEAAKKIREGRWRGEGI